MLGIKKIQNKIIQTKDIIPQVNTRVQTLRSPKSSFVARLLLDKPSCLTLSWYRHINICDKL